MSNPDHQMVILQQQSEKSGRAPTASEGRYQSWKELWIMQVSVHGKLLKTKTKEIMCKHSHSGKSGLGDVPLSYAWKVTSKVTSMLAAG